MEVRVNDVAAPISLMVISRKDMVSLSSAQAAMISSRRAAVSAAEPLDMDSTSLNSKLTPCHHSGLYHYADTVSI